MAKEVAYLLHTTAFHSSSFSVCVCFFFSLSFLSRVGPFANKVNPHAASWHVCRGSVLLCYSVVKRALWSVVSPSRALLMFLLMNRARALSDLAPANSISRECGRSHGLLATFRQPMADRGGCDRLLVAYGALREASVTGAIYWDLPFLMASCSAFIMPFFFYTPAKKKCTWFFFLLFMWLKDYYSLLVFHYLY